LSGVKYSAPVASEKFRIVRLNTGRRPILSAIQAQNAAPNMAPIPDDSRTVADCRNVSFHGPTTKATTNPIRK